MRREREKHKFQASARKSEMTVRRRNTQKVQTYRKNFAITYRDDYPKQFPLFLLVGLVFFFWGKRKKGWRESFMIAFRLFTALRYLFEYKVLIKSSFAWELPLKLPLCYPITFLRNQYCANAFRKYESILWSLFAVECKLKTSSAFTGAFSLKRFESIQQFPLKLKTFCRSKLLVEAWTFNPGLERILLQ